jgi:hypothetical protein
MSLLSTASLWKNGTDKKKRQSSMKKPSLSKEDDGEHIEEPFSNISETFKNANKEGMERNERVINLINKMTTENDEDNKDLVNFEPLANPTVHVKKDSPSLEENNLKYNPNQHRKVFSNYTNAYNAPEFTNKQYVKPVVQNNDKFLEKINYMIRLLEEQQHEKTENITEEFILYGFLGIFVIYVVDSFTKCGKYIR